MSILQDILSGISQGFETIFMPPPAHGEKPSGKDLPLTALWEPDSLSGEVHKSLELADGGMRVGTMDVPAPVVRQLRELGHPIETYTPGQLKEAIDACAYDNTLIDDHDGVGFSDRLSKDAREAHEDMYDDDMDTLAYRRRAGRVNTSSPSPAGKQQSWVERIGASASAQHESFVGRLQEERLLAQSQLAEISNP